MRLPKNILELEQFMIEEWDKIPNKVLNNFIFYFLFFLFLFLSPADKIHDVIC
jgi:hypothetical protein